jgi:hypothetical protein
MTMADIFPVSATPKFVATTGVHGLIGVFGNTSDEDGNGAMQFTFSPDVDFIAAGGAIVVMGRTMGISTTDTTVPFMPIPYKRVTVNNVASDYAVSSATITGPGLIHVPANGMAIGLLFSIPNGTVTIGNKVVAGAAAP